MKKEELKSWRKSRGVTQVELAEALGVKKLAVSRWERGERKIPPFLRLALRSLETVKPLPGGKVKSIDYSKPKYTRYGNEIDRTYPGSHAMLFADYAIAAISQLTRIMDDDSKKELAFEKVITWITENRYGRKRN